MGKTEETKNLERQIWNATVNQRTFGCFEVTIGWFGKRRVDYMTMDTDNIFRFYEIKTSKSDFYSKADHTFLGHYNYYVMPEALYEIVKQDVPKHIGVYNGTQCIKKARKVELSEDSQLLRNSMIRSLCRDVGKQVRSGNITHIEILQHEIQDGKRTAKYYQELYEKTLDKLFLIENPQRYAIDTIVTVDPVAGDTYRKGKIIGYGRNGYEILYEDSCRDRFVDEDRIKPNETPVW